MKERQKKSPISLDLSALSADTVLVQEVQKPGSQGRKEEAMNYILVDPESPVPAYLQIQEQIRARVSQGSLLPGAPLPSVRQLAADLGLNPNTVAKAYLLLERERILRTVSRRGTLVAETAPDRARRRAAEGLEQTLEQLLQQAGDLGWSGSQLLAEMKRKIKEKPVAAAPRKRNHP